MRDLPALMISWFPGALKQRQGTRSTGLEQAMKDILQEAEEVAAQAEVKARQLHKESLVFRYLVAHVHGDFDALVAVWAEAEPDPALANLLYQVAEDLASEEAQRLGIGEEGYAQAHVVVQRVLKEWKEQR